MIDPELRVRMILRFAQSWPIRALSWLLEKGVPAQKGFGKFRARERIVDIADLEESTRTTDLSDRRFFTQANGTPADAWWHEKIRMLRMLETKTMLAEAMARRRQEADERNQTRLVTICIVVMLAAFAVALYAMRYLP